MAKQRKMKRQKKARARKAAKLSRPVQVDSLDTDVADHFACWAKTFAAGALLPYTNVLDPQQAARAVIEIDKRRELMRTSLRVLSGLKLAASRGQ